MADLIALTEYVALDATGALVTDATAYFYEAGTSTPLTVYTDSGLGTPHGTSLAFDSEGKLAQCWVASAQGVKVDVQNGSAVSLPGFPIDNFPTHPESAATATDTGFTPVTGNAATDVQTAIANEAARANKAQNFLHLETSGGSSNAYTLTPAVTVSAYSDGLGYTFRANHANTGAATLDVSGVGAVAIQKIDSSNAKAALASGDIAIGDVVQVRHDGTNFVVVNIWRTGGGDEVELTDAATIAWDMTAAVNATVTLGGNRTLGNPTNVKVGQSGILRIVQDATGGRTVTLGGNYEYDVDFLVDETADAETLFRYTAVSATRIVLELVKRRVTVGPTSLSSTDVDFTVPTHVNSIKVIINGLSPSGTDNLLVRAIVSGSEVATGYVSATSDSATEDTSTAGMIVKTDSAAAVLSGTMRWERQNGNNWVSDHSFGTGADATCFGGGHISLAGSLEGIRLSLSGTDTFDAGSVTVMAEF